ncbi:hypothetical protein PLUTE_a3563 [Pseudoalteromonas luteoviolacea DSM 6061]|nr:hypothetical protein [Pseudoalteromonas luteoviolacea DSM 6061]
MLFHDFNYNAWLLFKRLAWFLYKFCKLDYLHLFKFLEVLNLLRSGILF